MAQKRGSQKRSTLKQKPLRQAGQSVEEKRTDIIIDALGFYVCAAAAVLYAVLEWIRAYKHEPYNPWLWTIIAAVVVSWATYKIRASFKENQNYREGRDGERLVAERLEELRTAGFYTLHDIVAGNFNIDHVLIGPSGVLAIETKTLSKRGGPDEKAEFNGKEILIHGNPLPRNPVAQAQANANWLRDFLRESTGQPIAVTPVVILPGWYVNLTVTMPEVIVLNDHPSGLQAYLVNQPVRFSATDIALVKTHLSLFVRKSV